MAPFPSWRLCSVPHVKRGKLWKRLPLLLAQPRVVQGLVTAVTQVAQLIAQLGKRRMPRVVMKLMKVVMMMMMMMMMMWGMTRWMPVEGATQAP